MAHPIQVVFRSNVRGIARAGEKKRVAPGFARNYLFPRNLAFLATEPALKQWETERQGTLTKAGHRQDMAQELASKIEASPVSFKAKAGLEGRLYGSITRPDIAEALKKAGTEVEKRAILLNQPIRQLGTFDVRIRLGADTYAILKVTVEADR